MVEWLVSAMPIDRPIPETIPETRDRLNTYNFRTFFFFLVVKTTIENQAFLNYRPFQVPHSNTLSRPPPAGNTKWRRSEGPSLGDLRSTDRHSIHHLIPCAQSPPVASIHNIRSSDVTHQDQDQEAAYIRKCYI